MMQQEMLGSSFRVVDQVHSFIMCLPFTFSWPVQGVEGIWNGHHMNMNGRTLSLTHILSLTLNTQTFYLSIYYYSLK